MDKQIIIFKCFVICFKANIYDIVKYKLIVPILIRRQKAYEQFIFIF